MSKRKNNRSTSVFLQEDNGKTSDTVENALAHSISQSISVNDAESVKTGHTYKDAFSNPGARTGWGQPNLLNMTEYPMTRLTQNWSLLLSLYRSSWIIQQVCSVIPEDSLTDMHIEAPQIDNERQSDLDACIAKTNLRHSIIDAMKWARLFGGSAAIIMVEGQEKNMEEPLRIRDILPGSFRGLFVVDRWSGIYPSIELVTNRRSPDYGLPKYYEVRDESGCLKYRVHHSRVIRFIGEQMPYYESITEQGWGTSCVEALYDSIVGHDNVFYNIANLTFKACLSVFEVDGLDQIFASASANAQKRMYSMIEAMSIMESSNGVRMVNKGDQIQQMQANFSGLPEVMDMFMLEVAGATKIPATRLFGRSPAGMNSSGESDAKNYRLTLEQTRAKSVMPALDKLMPVICMSVLGRVPSGVNWKLPSLMELPPSERQQLVDATSNLLERLFQANLIPADAVLNGIRNTQRDQDITTTITDKMVEKVKDKYMKDLSGGSDPYGGMGGDASMGGQQQQGEGDQELEKDENGNQFDQTGSLAVQQKTASGKEITQNIDAQGNLLFTSKDKDGNAIERSVDENGRSVVTTLKNGKVEKHSVDENGNPVTTSQDEMGNVIEEKMAPDGRKIKKITTQEGIETKQTTDNHGRAVVITKTPEGLIISQRKDRRGNLVVFTKDPNGNQSVQYIDGAGRVIKKTKPVGTDEWLDGETAQQQQEQQQQGNEPNETMPENDPDKLKQKQPSMAELEQQQAQQQQAQQRAEQQPEGQEAEQQPEQEQTEEQQPEQQEQPEAQQQEEQQQKEQPQQQTAKKDSAISHNDDISMMQKLKLTKALASKLGFRKSAEIVKYAIGLKRQYGSFGPLQKVQIAAKLLKELGPENSMKLAAEIARILMK